MSEYLWTFAIRWAAGPTSIATRAVCYCCTQSVIIFCNSSAASVTLTTRKLPKKSMDKTWMPPDWELGFSGVCASKLWKGLFEEQYGIGSRQRAVSYYFLLSHSRSRARERGKQRKSEQAKIRVVLSPPLPFYSFYCHLHNFTFLNGARGSQERRTTARGLEWEQLSYTLSLKKINLHVNL